MNDAPEENLDATDEPKPRHRRLRGWLSRQSRLRLGLIGVVALGLVAGTWTGVSYASDGSEPVAAAVTTEAPGDSQLLSPDPFPSAPPKEKKTEKEKDKKAKKPQSKPSQEEEKKPKPTKTEDEVAPGCGEYSGNQRTACNLLDDYGFGTDQMSCLAQLWDHESGWNHEASNPSSGAYGIPQALPGGKMASAGGDWSTNPATQIKWGLGYIGDRYGDPCGAWGFWQANNYY